MAGKWIDHWEPDDEQFWESTGKPVARRNLSFSIFAELLGFSVWVVWGVVATKLNDNGFDFSTSQLFWLVSIPGLIGATMRFPYTFMPARIGGRNWTIISALLLLIPTVLLTVMVRDPSTPYALLMVAAATAGLGGGNFSSSMANISYFYPEGRKGLALGLNAAGGNLGVAVTLLVVPLAVASGRLELAGVIWIPFILVAGFCAWRYMDNLTNARSAFGDQRVIVHQRQTWLMTILYIGAFGSFIGYSAGLPLLIDNQFPENQVALAFLGPLVGSASRPLGGWLSDRLGGARVTLAVFLAMAVATLGVIFFITQKEQSWAFAGFLATFIVLFILSGLANGSTFRMVPAIWRAQTLEQAEQTGESTDDAIARSRREGAAVLGFIGAVAAYGGFVIPQAYNASISLIGGPEIALAIFCAYYLFAAGVTWRCYLWRKVTSAAGARRVAAGSLAHDRV